MTVRYDFTDRTAIVTGGARGIGLAISRRLHRDGAAVAIWDMDKAAGEVAAAGLGERAVALAVDVTDYAAVEAALAATEAQLGPVSILCNNAGIAGPAMTSWEYALEDWHAVIDLDLNGVYYGCRAVVPGMIERGYGRIVNTASIAGKEGNPNAAAYSAAKAAVIGLTKSLGKETVGTGVLVNCVAPAAVETDIFKQITPAHIEMMRSKIPLGRFGTVDEVASIIAWLCSSECSFQTGAVFDVSGGRATY
ncbi:MAG: SDR family NAD(P)-dependent oxidoreductase [Alphaproteobacteria bacterium]|nr:SDR family NAD(P)-dependent oxidoreductase [Alphaproteobacteria bacterium]MCY4231744.1 SDR family NAD(P)-dependent oxidoreductase [Alphaproteobacteria bacterium]